MRAMQIWFCLLIALASLSVCLAATPTSFCKCTCFTNSKIIPLDDSSKSVAASAEGKVKKRTCSDCNKQFCLDYNLAICKEATEADVFTTCFQRDSRKDEAVVFIFIFVTVGLLTWAGAKPWIDKWQNNRGAEQVYVSVDGTDQDVR